MKDKISFYGNKYIERLGYSVIGAYALGAAKNTIDVDERAKATEIGREICTYKRTHAEAYNPINSKIDLNNTYSSPERMNTIHNMISYGEDIIKDVCFTLSNARGISEAEKLNTLKKEFNTITKEICREAYSEGMMDDELKADLELILREGKERFLERVKEASNQEAVEVEPAEIPMPEQQMDPNMQNQNMDMMNNPDGGFEYDGFMDGQDTNTEDLGFDQGFGDFSIDNSQDNLDNASKDMSEFADSDDDNNEEDSKGEGFTFAELSKLVAKGEGNIARIVANANTGVTYEEDRRFLVNGNLTTIRPNIVNDIVEEVLSFENQLYNAAVSAGEGTSIINDENYQTVAKASINQLVLVLTTRAKLNI